MLRLNIPITSISVTGEKNSASAISQKVSSRSLQNKKKKTKKKTDKINLLEKGKGNNPYQSHIEREKT